MDKILPIVDNLPFAFRYIMYWKNLNLDKVANKQVKALFVKGITREIDLAFINDNVLYFVEYKNWGTTAFSVSASKPTVVHKF